MKRPLYAQGKVERVMMAAFVCSKCHTIRPYGFIPDTDANHSPLLQCDGGHISAHRLIGLREFEVRSSTKSSSADKSSKIFSVTFMPLLEATA